MNNTLLILCFITSHLIFAQVGVGTTNPNPKSMLEVASTSDGGMNYKGFMPPRVPTETDRNAINPGYQDYGLLVFVEETGCLEIWDGSAWHSITCNPTAMPEIWINEIHYDNESTDEAEGIEIAGQSGTDLSDYQLVLYNGSNGQVYHTRNLIGGIDNESNGFGAISFMYPTNGIQNGNPDGIALVKISTGNIIQFLSYRGVFVATNGPASGIQSVDIGVNESSSTPSGQSLQLTGTGNEYSQFTWENPSLETMGELNTGQIIN